MSASHGRRGGSQHTQHTPQSPQRRHAERWTGYAGCGSCKDDCCWHCLLPQAHSLPVLVFGSVRRGQQPAGFIRSRSGYLWPLISGNDSGAGTATNKAALNSRRVESSRVAVQRSDCKRAQTRPHRTNDDECSSRRDATRCDVSWHAVAMAASCTGSRWTATGRDGPQLRLRVQRRFSTDNANCCHCHCHCHRTPVAPVALSSVLGHRRWVPAMAVRSSALSPRAVAAVVAALLLRPLVALLLSVQPFSHRRCHHYCHRHHACRALRAGQSSQCSVAGALSRVPAGPRAALPRRVPLLRPSPPPHTGRGAPTAALPAVLSECRVSLRCVRGECAVDAASFAPSAACRAGRAVQADGVPRQRPPRHSLLPPAVCWRCHSGLTVRSERRRARCYCHRWPSRQSTGCGQRSTEGRRVRATDAAAGVHGTATHHSGQSAGAGRPARAHHTHHTDADRLVQHAAAATTATAASGRGSAAAGRVRWAAARERLASVPLAAVPSRTGASQAIHDWAKPTVASHSACVCVVRSAPPLLSRCQPAVARVGCRVAVRLSVVGRAHAVPLFPPLVCGVQKRSAPAVPIRSPAVVPPRRPFVSVPRCACVGRAAGRSAVHTCRPDPESGTDAADCQHCAALVGVAPQAGPCQRQRQWFSPSQLQRFQ